MIILKTERDLEAMRPACAVACKVLQEVAEFIRPGVTTREIDEYAAVRIKQHGAKSAFLGYRKYPCHVCISVNEQVVHGLAGDRFRLGGQLVAVVVPHEQPRHGHEGAGKERHQGDRDDDQPTQGRLDPSGGARPRP